MKRRYGYSAESLALFLMGGVTAAVIVAGIKALLEALI